MLTGTISGAAKLLNVSQPAVTKVLLHAEDQIGFKLFVRHKGRIVPTDEANLLYCEAQKVYAAVDTLRGLANNLRAGGESRVRIGAPPALCLDVIPSVITSLRKDSPEIIIEVYAHHYAGAISAVLRQDVHLALAFNPQEHPALKIDHFSTARFIGCLPANLSAGLPPSVGLEAFQRQPFIALSGADPLGAAVKAAFRLAVIQAPICAEVNSNALALDLVARGVGACIVDEFTAVLAPASVTTKPITPDLTFEVGIVTLANASSSKAIERLRGALLRYKGA